MSKQEAHAVATRSQAPLEIVPSEAASLMEVISRSASDPSIDVNKLERLMSLYDRVKASKAEQDFNEAMNAVQSETHRISADAVNPSTKSKYASYSALDRVLRPIYTKHGFALSFDSAEGAPENYVRVVCHVMHSGGHRREYQLDMPADGKGAKGGDVMTKTHAVGSGMSYGMRYLLKMIWNVAVGEDDDDGNAASTETITEDQALELDTLISQAKTDRTKFLDWIGVDHILKVPARHFDKARDALAQKISKNQKEAAA